MIRPRITIAHLMSGVAFAAMFFWIVILANGSPGYLDPEIAVAVYLSVLTFATLLWRYGPEAIRPFCLGVAAYGWVFLAFGVHFMLGDWSNGSNSGLARRCLIALPLGLMVGIASQWLVVLRRREGDSPKADAPPEPSRFGDGIAAGPGGRVDLRGPSA